MLSRSESNLSRSTSLRTTWLAALLLYACSAQPDGLFETRNVVNARLAQAEQKSASDKSLDRTLAEVMVTQIRDSKDQSMRLKLAHNLGDFEEDWVVPHLLVSLSYERDEGTRLEIARTLARHNNWAGLDTLYLLASNGTQEAIRTNARRSLDELARDAEVQDADALWRLWNHGDMDEKLPFAEPSALYRFEVWKRIAQLADENHGDALFALSNSQAWVAAPLAAALHDENKQLAQRAAQCLQGLGVRGNIAGPDLVLALEAPWLATQAAAALGRVAYPAAGSALVRCLAPDREPELRLAATRSLGLLGLPATVPALEGLLAKSEPTSLRSAATAALIRMNSGEAPIRVALALLREGGEPAAEVESALGLWLEQSAKVGDERSRTALESWNAPVTPPSIEPTPAEILLRRTQRAAAIESLLSGSAQE